MNILKSLNPRTGFTREFELEAGRPVILGTLSLEKIFSGLRAILKRVPDDLKKQVNMDIDGASRSITMGDCSIDPKYISRAHCIIFPGEGAKIMDLASTNGTRIAGRGGGTKLDPGRKIQLNPGDIIILANGLALFHYLERDEDLGDGGPDGTGVGLLHGGDPD